MKGSVWLRRGCLIVRPDSWPLETLVVCKPCRFSLCLSDVRADGVHRSTCSFKAGLPPFLWSLVLSFCWCVCWGLDAQHWHLWLFICWYVVNWFMWRVWEMCALSGMLLTKGGVMLAGFKPIQHQKVRSDYGIIRTEHEYWALFNFFHWPVNNKLCLYVQNFFLNSS